MILQYWRATFERVLAGQKGYGSCWADSFYFYIYLRAPVGVCIETVTCRVRAK